MSKERRAVEPTALIRVSPSEDEAIVKLHAEALNLESYAGALVIANDEDVKRATDDLSIIARLTKALEEKRREYNGPINDHLKAVNETFKLFSGPIERANTITRQKILDYRREQERVRQEQERINQLRREAAEAEMKLKGELTEPVAIVEVAPAPPPHYRTEMGTLGTAKVRKWEVEDLSKVPLEYLMVDAAKVGKLVRAGMAAIPGIRIWEEESLRVTSR